MKIEFNDSFLKDLRAVKDKSVLAKVKASIEAAEQADTLDNITNLDVIAQSVVSRHTAILTRLSSQMRRGQRSSRHDRRVFLKIESVKDGEEVVSATRVSKSVSNREILRFLKGQD